MNTVAIYPTGILSPSSLTGIYLIVYVSKKTIWDFLDNGLQPCYHDLTGDVTLVEDLSSGWLQADCTLFEIMKNASDQEFRSYSALPAACSWPFGRPSLALARLYKRITTWDSPEVVLTPKLMKSVCRQALQQSKKVSEEMSLSDQIIQCYLKIKFRMIRCKLDYHLISGRCLLKDLFLCQLLTCGVHLAKLESKAIMRWRRVKRLKEKERTEQVIRLIQEERERTLRDLPLRPELFLGDEQFLRCWLDVSWGADWPTLVLAAQGQMTH
ncbi:non-structural protein [Kaisodi virus]|uniref:NSs n=1 Tax=Kaisodi virus TaxID=1564120 RepID=A0A384ZKF6_9VIRU|nr:non-structural protein [Kaisodi virus]AWW17498.1 non-structural protein [Kaisodi virus]QLA46859.1 NSs [Kaisodi virus]